MICSSVCGGIDDDVIEFKLLIPDTGSSALKLALLCYGSRSTGLGEKRLLIIRDGLENALVLPPFEDLVSLC